VVIVGLEMTEDFTDICYKIKSCMDFRTRYMQISCQSPGMNPVDDPNVVFDQDHYVFPHEMPLMDSLMVLGSFLRPPPASLFTIS